MTRPRKNPSASGVLGDGVQTCASEKFPLLEALRRLTPATQYHTGQQAQHTTNEVTPGVKVSTSAFLAKHHVTPATQHHTGQQAQHTTNEVTPGVMVSASAFLAKHHMLECGFMSLLGLEFSGFICGIF